MDGCTQLVELNSKKSRIFQFHSYQITYLNLALVVYTLKIDENKSFYTAIVGLDLGTP